MVTVVVLVKGPLSTGRVIYQGGYRGKCIIGCVRGGHVASEVQKKVMEEGVVISVAVVMEVGGACCR